MIQYQADRPPHPTVSTFSLKFPNNHASIISDFRAHLRTLPERSAPLSTDGGRKIVAIIDGIIASPAAYLPWKDLVQVCREEGVWSIVDAAHCIGQEVDINLSEAKPDFWVSVRCIHLSNVDRRILSLAIMSRLLPYPCLC